MPIDASAASTTGPEAGEAPLKHDPLIPAHAGLQGRARQSSLLPWVPAFAGTSGIDGDCVRGAQAAESLLIRVAREGDIVAIHRFMLANAVAEMAEAEVDPVIYMHTLYDTVTQGAGLIAVIDRHIVGYLGLWTSRYDYSRAAFMHDRGFYVLPAHRGAVGAALLREAKTIAQEAGMTLKIIDTNPTRNRRRAVTGQIIGFRPAGRVFTQYVKG